MGVHSLWRPLFLPKKEKKGWGWVGAGAVGNRDKGRGETTRLSRNLWGCVRVEGMRRGRWAQGMTQAVTKEGFPPHTNRGDGRWGGVVGGEPRLSMPQPKHFRCTNAACTGQRRRCTRDISRGGTWQEGCKLREARGNAFVSESLPMGGYWAISAFRGTKIRACKSKRGKPRHIVVARFVVLVGYVVIIVVLWFPLGSPERKGTSRTHCWLWLLVFYDVVCVCACLSPLTPPHTIPRTPYSHIYTFSPPNPPPPTPPLCHVLQPIPALRRTPQVLGVNQAFHHPADKVHLGREVGMLALPNRLHHQVPVGQGLLELHDSHNDGLALEAPFLDNVL